MKFRGRTWGWAEVFAALSVLCAIIFVFLATGVSQLKLLPGDVEIMQWLHAQANPLLNQFFITLTHVGDSTVVLALSGLLAGYLAFKKKYKKAGVVLLLVGGSILLNLVFKAIFHRARPELWEHLIFETGYSFPSGHVMLSTSLLAGIVITTWNERGKKIILATAIVLAFIVGVSRMYIGVHYPSDVLAGWSVVLSLAFALTAIGHKVNLFRAKMSA